MQVARHPVHHRHVDVQDYVIEFGKPTADDPNYEPPTCTCIACVQAVPLRPRVPSPHVTQHFTHQRDLGFCPTKTQAGTPYIGLRPNNPDAAAATALRLAFRANWQRHYEKIGGRGGLLPLMAIGEFISMLEGADAANIWGHVGLTERDVPYVLVITRDFTPWTGIKKGKDLLRRFWFRFWFDHRIDRVPVLWIHRPEDVMLQRASFQPPRSPRGRPDGNALVRIVELPVTGEFLNQPAPQVPEWVVQRMNVWFAAHWHQ